MDENAILVAQNDQTAYLHVSGKGSFKNAKAVKSFYESAVKDGAQRCVFDLQNCTHMDSTFMGVLAAIAAEQKRMQFAAPLILHLTPRNRELLETLGLNRVLETPEHAPEELNAQLSLLQPESEDSKQDSARTMLEAHEELINLDEKNRAKFRDVVDYLRDKLQSENDS